MTQREQDGHGTRVTRRGMLQTGAAFTVGTGALAMTATSALATSDDIPESWDESYDVVVIGSGFAGLSAAYEARKAGASVALFEKMPSLGGNSAISGGGWSVPGTPLQAATGIEDSPDDMLRDMLSAGLEMNHIELTRKVAYESLDALMWSINEIGVEYGDTLVHFGGHAVPRAYSTASGMGAGITGPMIDRLRENGVEPRTRVMLQQILRDGDGRVKGVVVREGVPFPDDGSGDIRTVKASRAVVLATGGFGNDVAFRQMQDPRLAGELDTTNQPGATAESLRAALNIGCVPIQLSWIQIGPWTSPDERGFGLGPLFAQGVSAMHGIWLDTRTGQRFVNELADRKVRSDEILRVGNETIAIVDGKGYARGSEEVLAEMLERDVLMQFETLDDMAEAFGMSPDTVRETVNQWNSAVAAGEDVDHTRPLQFDQEPMDTAPWYVMRLSPKIHHTMGGVAINTEAQALDVLTDQRIPGLYCAGEITGGVHGAVRLGGCAYGDAIVFGRTAGRNAASEEEWG